MKRYLITLTILLLSLVLNAQSGFTYHYWFDQDTEHRQTGLLGDGHLLLDADDLEAGVHMLHVTLEGSGLTSPQTYLFYKFDPTQASPDLVYHYWFDQDTEHRQSGLLGDGHLLLNADDLETGVHTLHLALEGNGMTSSQAYLFYKFDPTQASFDLIYHYWFDQDTEHRQSGLLGNGHLLLEADTLELGVHMLHLALEGNGMTSSQAYLFYKFDPTQASPDLVYHYWFDQDTEHRQTGLLGDGHLLLDADDLETGVHTLHVTLEGSGLNPPQSYIFYKFDPTQASPDLVYHYWFDQAVENRQTGLLGDGHLLLDADTLEIGVHALHVTLEDGELTSSQTYMFYKPESTGEENPNYALHYWFDDDNTVVHSVPVGSAFELEVGDLSDGLHALRVQLDNGKFSVPQCYWFYKRPVGGYISGWEYWVNDDNVSHATKISPNVDTLGIITLLPVEQCPIRSSCFHFHPNGDAPCINAKNKITFRVWIWDSFAERSAMYVDENVSEPIVADTLERNTITTIPVPGDNQIQWFWLDAHAGDYLSFQADKACTMQLFAPSGEEIYAASGPESIVLEGFNVWEDGAYYLAVHDVTGSGETVSITYNWIYRYTISDYDVHLVGNGGCSTITFQGNGFNSLLDMYLVNTQNDTIRSLDIGHESNTLTTVSLNFYQENLGVYDAVFQFYGEAIRINGALEVQEPVDITLTTTVSYPSTFLINTPCTYTYTITNNGNMSAYVVPIYVYISSQTEDGISHLEFDGLDLPSVIDGVDLDSMSVTDVAFLRAWAEEMGEDHYFIRSRTVDEATEDSIYVRSNFFFMNLASFETRTLTLRITSDEPINVYITVPNDTVQPLTLVQGRGFWDRYCCVQDKLSCWFDLTCNVLDLASAITSCAPGTPIAITTSILSCICGIASSANSITSELLCGEGHSNSNSFWGYIWEELKAVGTATSIVGSITKCFSSFLPGNPRKIAKLADNIIEKMSIATSSINTHSSAITCSSFTEPIPDCPKGDSPGGPSNPVNSLDPNEIHGYLSESGSHYMRQEIQNVQYEIEFENDTTLATAAAHTIIVRDTLDATKFDLNSLAARSVTIGDKRLDLNGEQTFARTLDLRPELYVIAQIEQDYDLATGIIQWTIQSLDPMTMEPTDDPYQGVLPVNYFGNGVGFIDYSINLKQAFADGTAINNRAGIIFDQNDVIMTPTWTNVVDAVKPVSYIESAEFIDDSLSFSFVSSDNRSGMWYHTLYYRNNSTEMEWRVKVPRIFENSYMLQFDEYQTTEYLVMAVDSAGNHEEKDMMAEYVYFYDGPEPVCQSDMLVQGWNWWSTYLDITLADLKTALVEALPGTTINIKSQTQNVKYQNGRWAGQLTTLDLTRMYMISVENDCEISLVGMPINLSGLTATIISGANWLAFPYSESISVSDFFGSFPMNNDLVKSQSQNAKYQNNRWGGQLNTLVPGKGYIYISNSPGTRTFTFPTSTK
jgi:hypothetical protein